MAHHQDVHRSIVTFDVERFSDPTRTNQHQGVVRDGLNAAVRVAFERAGAPIDERFHTEDRGDGLFVLVPADVPKSKLVTSLPHELLGALLEHNARYDREARIRLRVAVHAGEVEPDRHGVLGADLITAFRLLEAPALKRALAGSPGVLAVAVSEWFYEHVVQHHPASRPENYRRHRVRVKETSTTAWLCLPDYPYPASDAHRAPAPEPPQARKSARAWSRPGRKRLPTLRAPALLLVVLLVLGLSTDLLASAGQPALECPNPVQLNVLTSTEMAPLLRELAIEFERHTRGADERGCGRARVLVLAAAYDDAVETFSRGWAGSTDLRDRGPEPHVWVPDSTVDVRDARQRMAPGTQVDLVTRAGFATSPLVLAAPADLAAGLAPQRQLFDWAAVRRVAQGAPGRAFLRPDPTRSSAGLLATVALYRERLESSDLAASTLTRPWAPQRLHEVEQTVPALPGADSGDLLCALRSTPGRAVLVSEKAGIDHNLGNPLGSACAAERREPLRFLYPEAGAPVQDHPFVVVTWTDRPANERRLQVIDWFHEFLRDAPSRETVRAYGYRDPDGRGGNTAGPLAGLPPALPLDEPVDGRAALDAWRTARLPARVLFGVDASAGMSEVLGLKARSRIAAEAVRAVLALFWPQDQVGLFTFADRPGDNDDERDAVALQPGRASEVRSASQREPVEGVASDLYDALSSGADRLGSPGAVEASSALVLVADVAAGDLGRKDLPGLARKLATTTPRVRVFVLGLGAGACGPTGVGDLAAATGGRCVEITGAVVPDAFRDLVATGLWG